LLAVLAVRVQVLQLRRVGQRVLAGAAVLVAAVKTTQLPLAGPVPLRVYTAVEVEVVAVAQLQAVMAGMEHKARLSLPTLLAHQPTCFSPSFDTGHICHSVK